MADKQQLEQIIYVSWEESERGWGTRPDGSSLHLTIHDFRVFLKEYWDTLPDSPPSEYSRPADKPVIVYASPELYMQIQEENHGLRLSQHEERKLVSEKALVYRNQRSG